MPLFYNHQVQNRITASREFVAPRLRGLSPPLTRRPAPFHMPISHPIMRTELTRTSTQHRRAAQQAARGDHLLCLESLPAKTPSARSRHR